jgi:hypothetical protein
VTSRKDVSERAGVRAQKAAVRTRDAESGWAAHKAELEATTAKIARLRSLRLAREAEEKQSAPAPKAPKGRSKKKA